jgi:hypothetical protein
MWKLFGILAFSTVLLQATSVRLQNDSLYTLKASIHSADGSALDEVDVAPGGTVVWDDSQGDWESRRVQKSKTPLTIYWYCQEGEAFGISDHVSSGALVKSSHANGRKTCRKVKEEAS